MKKVIPMIILALVAAATIGWIVYSEEPIDDSWLGVDMGAPVSTEPKAFEEPEYDFGFQYPYDWQFASGEKITPKYSAYVKPAGVPVTPPFTHLANVTHVSVYPEGIPTEGFFGQSTEVDFDTGFELSPESEMYVLADGTPFAAYLVPASPPDSWTEAGFVWMRLFVEDQDRQCFSNGRPTACYATIYPLDEYVTGTVDTSVWETEKEIVRTLEFMTQ